MTLARTQVGYTFLDLTKIPFNTGVDAWYPIYTIKKMRYNSSKPELRLFIFKASEPADTACRAPPELEMLREVEVAKVQVAQVEVAKAMEVQLPPKPHNFPVLSSPITPYLPDVRPISLQAEKQEKIRDLGNGSEGSFHPSLASESVRMMC